MTSDEKDKIDAIEEERISSFSHTEFLVSEEESKFFIGNKTKASEYIGMLISKISEVKKKEFNNVLIVIPERLDIKTEYKMYETGKYLSKKQDIPIGIKIGARHCRIFANGQEQVVLA